MTGSNRGGRRSWTMVAALIVAMTVWNPRVAGQLITGSVTGSVLDPSGAAVAGASVKLVNTGTGVAQAVLSDTAGNFQFLLLPSGVYTIEIASPGFKMFRREGIVVEADRSLAVPVTLQVGQVTETIEVTGGTPLLEPNTSSLGTVMDRQKVVDLPLNGRNPMGLANLIPTVRGIGFFGGQVLSTWRLAAVSIGGGQPLTNGFLVDGMANDKIGDAAGPMTYLTVDATQEFKVLTNAMSAEFGSTGGGIISIISKSGANEYHGGLFEFFRNDKLNANDFFANQAGRARPPVAVNQFGGTLGGPLRRERAFFFLNYEGFVERRSQTRTVTSPTFLERAGDFSETRTASGELIKIFDPFTTRPDPSVTGAFIRDPFPGNVIPSNRITHFAREILDRYYTPGNLPGLPFTHAQNLSQVGKQPIDKHTWGVKVDYNLAQDRRLAVRYTRDTLDWQFPNFFGNVLETDGRLVAIPRHSVAIQYTDTIAPTLLLDAKAGFNRDGEQWTPPSSLPPVNGFDITTLGLPAALGRQLQTGKLVEGGLFPRMDIRDALLVGTFGGGGRPGQTWAAGAAITRIQGAHTVKTGYEYRFYQFNWFQTSAPIFNFDRGFTQGPDPTRASNAAGFGVASFLLGTPANGQAIWEPSSAKGQRYHAAFLQDDWKESRKLTLNLGLRWEYEGPLTDRFNTFSNFDPSIPSPLKVPGFSLTGGLVFPGVDGRPRGVTDPAYKDFGPRAGFAYQARKDLVIRGGYGILYVPLKGNAFSETGFRSRTLMVTSVDGGLTPFNTILNPFPNGVDRPTGSRLGALTGLGGDVEGQLRNVKPGYSQQWNFTLQFEPRPNWLVETAYIGNKGTHLLVIQGRNLNQLDPRFLPLGNDLLRPVANPFFGVFTSGPLSASTIPQQQLLRPFPQYTSVDGGYSYLGNSHYHAFALKVEKRFSRGFSFLTAYTVSKLIDDIGVGGAVRPGGTENSGVLNWYNLRAERSKSANDVPQRLVVTGLWELPFARAGNVLKRGALGGWQINAISTVESGRSIAVVSGGNRPNAVPGVSPKVSAPSLQKWFNTAAYSVPAPFTFGNSSRTIPNVMSDGVFNIDFSLFKNFPIGEKWKLQFRAEAFNLTNTPTFDTPGRDAQTATFGVVTATAFSPKPREIQLALRLNF